MLRINAAVSGRVSDATLKKGSILAAACALPGVVAAEGAPTEGLVAFKYLQYKDKQPQLDRITVKSPSLYTLLPIGSSWSVEGSVVVDDVSGATPTQYSTVSLASKMEDERTAGDIKLVRYFRRAAIGVGYAGSTEDDYKSNAFSFDFRFSTDDNNTTVALGAGTSDDKITPTARAFAGQTKTKKTKDFLVGVTQVMTPNDIIKANLTYSLGDGFFTDPYKGDSRPDERNSTVLLTQWNHHFERANGTLRTTYRYYTDTFDVTAHTFGFDYAQAFGQGWVVTPSLRYYTQSSASFYVDPQIVPGLGAVIPPTVPTTRRYYTGDQRLSAFGGITIGFKLAKSFGPWTVDFRYDRLEQRSDWRIGGEGSPNVDPFQADSIQFGIARKL
jgi:hypothetical protein